jgi:protein-tyrosine kinase
MSGIIEKALLRLETNEDTPNIPELGDLAGGLNSASERAPTAPKVLHLDLESLHKQGYLTAASISGRLSEQCRRIKRPVLSNLHGSNLPTIKRANLIAVTSSLAGEGKTFTTINLAMSIAQERDHTVLLVDADPVQRGLSRRLGVPSGLGLTDLLSDQRVGLADVIFGTNVPKLRVILAGSSNPHSTELLSSETMRQTVNELSDRYRDRIVLFDVPPLLAASQAAVLCGLVGQVLVVVEEGRTGAAEVRDAISLLDRDKVIGTILNKSDSTIGYDRYYGDYGEKSE